MKKLEKFILLSATYIFKKKEFRTKESGRIIRKVRSFNFGSY